MDIRFIGSDQDQQTNRILGDVADRAAALGIRLAGTLQRAASGQKCDIVLRLLPGGPDLNVSMNLGPGATGCGLDANLLEEAAMQVQARLPGAQALIANKFGKQEAAGHGLVQVIGQACTAGLPVLVGVSADWRAAFLAFAGDAAQPLKDADQALDWLRAACARQTA